MPTCREELFGSILAARIWGGVRHACNGPRGFGAAASVLLRAIPDEFHPGSMRPDLVGATAAGYAAANLSPLLCRFEHEEFAQFLNLFGWFDFGHPIGVKVKP